MSANPAAPAVTPKPKKSVALSGVPAGNTALCTVGRTGNDLHYRGYDILDIAERCEFEEIAFLLVHGKLPNRAELDGYKRKLRALRGVPAPVQKILERPEVVQRIAAAREALKDTPRPPIPGPNRAQLLQLVG